ncbi:MAG: FAD-dependent oxidoreductase [Clostridiales bacterium]|nr:FAD-dependent oxidoreductase [Clostridiales bacterium]
MKEIVETLRVPVKAPVDVIVAGGGFAGVAAALAARRCGADVLLLEKTASLGGLGTNGLISYYEPLCDGQGEQLMGGMAEELLHASIRYGDDTLPQIWVDRSGPADKSLVRSDKKDPIGGRYAALFSPTLCQLALDELLVHAGVQIRFDILVARPIAENGRLLGLMCESKSGREYFPASAFVDATGDADLFYRANCECVNGENYFTSIAHCSTVSEKKKALQNRQWLVCGSDLFGKGHPAGYPKMSGTTNEEISRFILDGRKAILDKVRQEDRTGRDIVALPGQAQFRKTRRIKGAYTITEKDLKHPQPDSIGVVGDFNKPGDWYEIPYGCLYAPALENVFAAGRMISADGWAWDVTRVIPVCCLTGQAAGTAAAFIARQNCTAADLPLNELQDRLTQQGVRLHKNP